MRTLYLDCGMGAAGDMLTAALSELLPDQDAFFEKMNALGIPGIHFEKEKTQKCGITGTHSKVTVNGEEEESLDVHHHDHDHHHDHEEHGEECTCGCHDHDHHHHHHADEVFTSWGKETPRKYTKEELDEILVKLSEETEFGIILRAKGMLPAADGTWLYFDLVPGEYEIRNGAPDYTGRLCVIGSKMDTDKLEKLFKL